MKAKKTRRAFIKITSTGIAGIIATSRLSAKGASATKSGLEKKYVYRKLGNTGIKLPVISSGNIPTYNDNLAKAILQSGIVHIDTAYRYDNGRSEEVLGMLLQDLNRDDYVIATKVPVNVDKETGDVSKDESIEKMNEMINTSLERLGVDFVDILYLHGASSRNIVLHKPYIDLLKQIKKQGKAKFVGVSTHNNQPEVINAVVESKFYDTVLTSFNFKMVNKDQVLEAINNAGKNGLGVIVMKVFAGGFLDKERTKPVNKKAAIKWILQNPNIHTTLLSFKSFEEIEEYMSVMNNLELTDEERNELELQMEETGLFCPGCNNCIEECKFNIPVPELMRAYMYAYGYNNFKQSKELLSSLQLSSNICEDCDICSVNCISGFQVQSKIKDIKRLLNVPNDFLT